LVGSLVGHLFAHSYTTTLFAPALYILYNAKGIKTIFKIGGSDWTFFM